MADTPTRLIAPTLLTAAAATLATSPAAPTIWVVTSIHIANTSANAVGVTVSFGADAAATRWLPAISVPGNGTYDWTGAYVMGASEVIQAYAATASVCNITVCGVVVT